MKHLRSLCTHTRVPPPTHSARAHGAARIIAWTIGVAIGVSATPGSILAQTKFHLHTETGTSGQKQLKMANPEVAAVTLLSPDLKNVTAPEYSFAAFDTADTPTVTGTIPAGSAIGVKLWMRKTSNWGRFKARFQLHLNDTGTQPLCTGTAASELTTTVASYTFSCTTSAAMTVYNTDRYVLYVSVNIITGAGSHSVKADLRIEGVVDGNYASYVTIPTPPPPPPPAPVIATISPTAGLAGSVVTISGANFGPPPGTSTVTFNGVTAPATNWSAGSITVPVPAGAVTGPVRVNTTAGSSNTLTFTVWTTGGVTGTVTRTADGLPVSGAVVDVLQSGLVRGTATTAPNGTYTIGTLTSGTYAVRFTRSGLATELRPNVAVGGGAATAVNVAMSGPGSIAGQVTDGSTGLGGVRVSARVDGAVAAGATTDGTGAYTLSGLLPRTYTVDATASGYASQSQSGIAVTEGGTSNVSFTLQSSASNVVRYVYDALSRLVAVIDVTGDTARYTYDAVGNVTSITRQSSAILSLIEFAPKSGPAGTSVTLRGTGFSATAANNVVTVGGVAATVTSASATAVVITVPSGVAAGPATLGVTVGASSVSSATTFTVTTALEPEPDAPTSAPTAFIGRTAVDSTEARRAGIATALFSTALFSIDCCGRNSGLARHAVTPARRLTARRVARERRQRSSLGAQYTGEGL